MGKTAKPIEILLVEDNPGDVRLTQEVLRDGKMNNNLYVAKDGVDAVTFLRREGAYTDAPVSDMILLDLNLPKKDGREVLAEIKDDLFLKRIPVVVLTTSKAEQDIHKAYDLHANCYITKPVDLDQFIRVVTSIENFWLTIVKLPRGEEDGRYTN
ncbi:MAG: response regulator [Candidatus Methanogasteraceae archaeon]